MCGMASRDVDEIERIGRLSFDKKLGPPQHDFNFFSKVQGSNASNLGVSFWSFWGSNMGFLWSRMCNVASLDVDEIRRSYRWGLGRN